METLDHKKANQSGGKVAERPIIRRTSRRSENKVFANVVTGTNCPVIDSSLNLPARDVNPSESDSSGKRVRVDGERGDSIPHTPISDSVETGSSSCPIGVKKAKRKQKEKGPRKEVVAVKYLSDRLQHLSNVMEKELEFKKAREEWRLRELEEAKMKREEAKMKRKQDLLVTLMNMPVLTTKEQVVKDKLCAELFSSS